MWWMNLLAALLVPQFVSTQDSRPPDPNNQFIRPPLPSWQTSVDASVFLENTVYTLGQQQSIPWSWKMNMSASISLFQEGNPSVVKHKKLIACPNNINYYYWDGTLPGIDLTVSDVFFLGVYNCSDPGSSPVFFSHYFNVTQPANASSTTSPISNPTRVGSSGTSLPSSTNSGSSVSSMNFDALGGGIGGGIGGAILLVGVGFLVFRWRREKRNSQQSLSQPSHQISYYRPPGSYHNETISSHYRRNELFAEPTTNYTRKIPVLGELSSHSGSGSPIISG